MRKIFLKHAGVLAFATAILAACVPAPSTTQTKVDTVSSSVEAASGIDRSALLAIQGISDGGGQMLYDVFYYAQNINRAQLDAAPARICAFYGKNLVSAEDKALEHPDTMPGVRKLMVRCK
ncbi:hypothetical protein [Cypionkella sp.]|uniref:hypothetical protein n=1 Tax=Cypionkella sp. TaxID=2811411 RepID=UPI002601BDD3|nr:hypothetical protein [Cypionkella sp.]